MSYIQGCDLLLPNLTLIFNFISRSAHFRKVWQESEIVPLHIKGVRKDVEHYRGVTFLYTPDKPVLTCVC